MKYKGYRKYSIDNQQRMAELRAFSRQYYDWIRELDAIKDIGSPSLDGMPHGTDIGSVVENAAIKRERYQDKIALLDRCIRNCSSDPGMQTAVKYSVTKGVGFNYLKAHEMIYYEVDAFYLARRKYYYELNLYL